MVLYFLLKLLVLYFLLQDAKIKDDIFKSTIRLKSSPTDPLQTTLVTLSEEDSPCMVSLVTLATVIFVLRTWSPGKNTIVVLEIKYRLASCAYSESVVHLVEF